MAPRFVSGWGRPNHIAITSQVRGNLRARILRRLLYRRLFLTTILCGMISSIISLRLSTLIRWWLARWPPSKHVVNWTIRSWSSQVITACPFPRAKASLYDAGSRVPLAVRWPRGICNPGRDVNAFVNLSDLAPTFLEAAGLTPPAMMTAQSLMEIFFFW